MSACVKITIFFAATVGLALCVAPPANAQGVADFYKGKTIQIVVGFGVGGGYDLYARALGRYLGKHIPGQPTVVVQNMEGAGSVRAANYVYSGSPQDGTVIAAVINELLGTKFKPIPGYAGSAQIHLAMERGEVMGRGGNSWASVQTANKSWVTERKINMLVQVGFEKEPELPDVPLLLDLVKTEEAVSIVKVISLPTAIGLGHWLAPGVPRDRIEALRAAS